MNISAVFSNHRTQTDAVFRPLVPFALGHMGVHKLVAKINNFDRKTWFFEFTFESRSSSRVISPYGPPSVPPFEGSVNNGKTLNITIFTTQNRYRLQLLILHYKSVVFHIVFTRWIAAIPVFPFFLSLILSGTVRVIVRVFHLSPLPNFGRCTKLP